MGEDKRTREGKGKKERIDKGNERWKKVKANKRKKMKKG